MNIIQILIDALKQWKCPSCGGSGTYLNKSYDWTGEKTEEKVPCKKCAGNGLHPIAQEALSQVE
jgi:DnaJ-class molecular chaperone